MQEKKMKRVESKSKCVTKMAHSVLIMQLVYDYSFDLAVAVVIFSSIGCTVLVILRACRVIIISLNVVRICFDDNT